MTALRPYTADELADLPDPALWVDEMDLPELALRLLATVDAERARADQLNTQADAMAEYLRDSLERLALTAGVPTEDDGGPRANFYLVDDVEQAITDLRAERDAERARADQAETALALADRALRDQPMQAFRTRAAQMRRAHAIDAVRRALDVSPTEPEPVDPRCTGTLGSRPSWMSPGQYDPCRCDLTTGHDGPHECEHTRADPQPDTGGPYAGTRTAMDGPIAASPTEGNPE